jgi:predicted transcriptional regulator
VELKFRGQKYDILFIVPWLMIGIVLFSILASNGLASSTQVSSYGTRQTQDTDGDGLSDPDEVKFGTDQNDPDSDDDGVLDGDEELNTAQAATHSDNDPDGDGWNNARDSDSDGDGILDGTEKGITEADINLSATDQGKGQFYPDQDPTTTTDMTKRDTDGDTWSDGDEDRNANGKVEKSQGETDPNFKDYDNDGKEDDKEDEDDDNDDIPDWFELKYSNALNPNNPDDRDEDYDADGFTNYREFLGNDNKPNDEDRDDSTNPEDSQSMPNIAPVVTFYGTSSTVDPDGNEIQRITVEAKQRITFNSTLLKVTDENEKAGLDFKWNWGDESDIYIVRHVVPNVDNPQTKYYKIPNVYTITLQVVDDIGNVGEGKLIVDVLQPVGVTGLVIPVNHDKTLNERNTIQRQGWIAYEIEDVHEGDKIVIDFTVTQSVVVTDQLGLRMFVLSKKSFETYKDNNPSVKSISTEYQEYWSSSPGITEDSKKIEMVAEKDDDLVFVFDNNYYEEGSANINFDEPIEYNVEIDHRKGQPSGFSYFVNNLLLLLLIPIVIIILIVVFFYTKMHRDRVLEHKTRDKIYSYITAHPGIHYRGVMQDLNLNMGVLSHHLNMLEQQHYIKSDQDGMYRRFYPVGSKLNNGTIIADAQKEILNAIHVNPGITQSDLAKTLNQNRKNVHYHVKKLSNKGMIRVEPAGRESHCFYLTGLDYQDPRVNESIRSEAS